MRPLFSLQGPRRREGRQPRFPEDLVAVGVADPGQIPLRPQEALQLHPGLIEHRGEGFRGERRIQRLYAQAADRRGLLNLRRPPDVQTGALLWSQLHQPEILTAVPRPQVGPQGLDEGNLRHRAAPPRPSGGPSRAPAAPPPRQRAFPGRTPISPPRARPTRPRPAPAAAPPRPRGGRPAAPGRGAAGRLPPQGAAGGSPPPGAQSPALAPPGALRLPRPPAR